MVVLLDALSVVTQNKLLVILKSDTVWKTYFDKFSPVCAPSKAWNARRLLCNRNFSSIQCPVIPGHHQSMFGKCNVQTRVVESKNARCTLQLWILPKNGIMFRVVQQSNAKLILPFPSLIVRNVSFNSFVASAARSRRRRRTVFLQGALAAQPLILIMAINFWNSGLSACLNGMLPDIKNLRI
jgi:hypothetical protein